MKKLFLGMSLLLAASSFASNGVVQPLKNKDLVTNLVAIIKTVEETPSYTCHVGPQGPKGVTVDSFACQCEPCARAHMLYCLMHDCTKYPSQDN